MNRQRQGRNLGDSNDPTIFYLIELTTLYRVEIHKDPFNSKIHVDCSKLIGDVAGSGSPCDSVDEILDSIRFMAVQWLRYDSIVGRQVEPPDIGNTEVIVDPKELISTSAVYSAISDAINKAKGVKTLKDFFG